MRISDWSSDVCSSDLLLRLCALVDLVGLLRLRLVEVPGHFGRAQAREPIAALAGRAAIYLIAFRDGLEQLGIPSSPPSLASHDAFATRLPLALARVGTGELLHVLDRVVGIRGAECLAHHPVQLAP